MVYAHRSAEHLTYRGNSQNNILPLIKLGSYIEVSHMNRYLPNCTK